MKTQKMDGNPRTLGTIHKYTMELGKRPNQLEIGQRI